MKLREQSQIGREGLRHDVIQALWFYWVIVLIPAIGRLLSIVNILFIFGNIVIKV